MESSGSRALWTEAVLGFAGLAAEGFAGVQQRLGPLLIPHRECSESINSPARVHQGLTNRAGKRNSETTRSFCGFEPLLSTERLARPRLGDNGISSEPVRFRPLRRVL